MKAHYQLAIAATLKEVFEAIFESENRQVVVLRQSAFPEILATILLNLYPACFSSLFKVLGFFVTWYYLFYRFVSSPTSRRTRR